MTLMTERNDIPEAVFTPKILLQIAHTFDQLGISQLMKTEA